MTRKIKLDANSIKGMVAGKSAETNMDSVHSVNSMCFSNDGLHMMAATDDDTMYLFDMKTGQKSKSVNSKKYGVSNVRFVADDMCALHSSTKVDNKIRFLSMADNKYLRYFDGHTDLVTSLSTNPRKDIFISSSNDKTIRIWDLKSPECAGVLNVPTSGAAAFDPDGVIFGVAIDSDTVKLFDVRSFDKGPFMSFNLKTQQSVSQYQWKSIVFSPDGKLIMITTNGPSILILDSFTGTLRNVLQGHENKDGVCMEASFTPDGKYIFSGSSDKKIYCWDSYDGTLVHKFATVHENTPRITLFSPVHFALASADKRIIFWCPSDDTASSNGFSNGIP